MTPKIKKHESEEDIINFITIEKAMTIIIILWMLTKR